MGERIPAYCLFAELKPLVDSRACHHGGEQIGTRIRLGCVGIFYTCSLWCLGYVNHVTVFAGSLDFGAEIAMLVSTVTVTMVHHRSCPTNIIITASKLKFNQKAFT